MKFSRTRAATASRGDETGRPDVLEQYECGPVRFSGDPNASYDRHLVFDHVVKPEDATPRERFEALARSLRDLLSQRWLKTRDTYDRENPKQVYYLSMEFLIGRSLSNNVLNLLVEPLVREVMQKQGAGPRPTRRGGTRRRARQRRPRPARRLLHRLDGHPRRSRRSGTACATSTASSARRSRTDARWSARQLAPPARPVGGRPPRGGGGRPRQLHGPGPRRGPDPHRRSPDRPPGGPLRPAGRRLRRQDGQYAEALGGGVARRLRLRRVQQRRLLRRRPQQGRGREPDPRPLPRRLHLGRRAAAVRAGVLPGLLLAGRHRPAIPRPWQRLEGSS